MLKIPQKTLSEVAEYLKVRYHILVTPEQIDKHIKDNDMRLEIIEDTWDDTYPREYIIDLLSLAIVGTHWPLYGDTEEYTKEFYTKATELGFIEIEDE